MPVYKTQIYITPLLLTLQPTGQTEETIFYLHFYTFQLKAAHLVVFPFVSEYDSELYLQ